MLDMGMFDKYGKVFQPDDIIFCEYEPGDDFYLILSGHIRITKVVGDVEKTLDVFEPGDIFGEMAILEQQARSATAIAVDEVKALNFNRQNFELLLQSNPQIAIKLLKMFCKRINDAKRQLTILTLDTPEMRIADVFCMLAEKQGVIADTAVEVEFKVSVQDISNMSGLKPEECNKVLSNLARQGKIELSDFKIVVKKISEFYRMVASKRKNK